MLSRARLAVSRLFQGPALLFTNCATCGTLMALGDGITQNMEIRAKRKLLHTQSDTTSGHPLTEEDLQYDWLRTLRMGIVGLAFGPLNHGWYWFLDKYLPQRSAKVIARKIVLDQTCASPVFITTFFVGMGLMEGKSARGSVEELKDKFVPVYMADWMFWPPVQILNFYFLPSHYRVFYVASATLLWNTYLSYAKHHKHASVMQANMSEMSEVVA